jgi:hypothetical protein
MQRHVAHHPHVSRSHPLRTGRSLVAPGPLRAVNTVFCSGALGGGGGRFLAWRRLFFLGHLFVFVFRMRCLCEVFYVFVSSSMRELIHLHQAQPRSSSRLRSSVPMNTASPRAEARSAIVLCGAYMLSRHRPSFLTPCQGRPFRTSRAVSVPMLSLGDYSVSLRERARRPGKSR